MITVLVGKKIVAQLIDNRISDALVKILDRKRVKNNASMKIANLVSLMQTY